MTWLNRLRNSRPVLAAIAVMYAPDAGRAGPSAMRGLRDAKCPEPG